MTYDFAIQGAAGAPNSFAGSPTSDARLTPREREIVTMLCSGYSNARIAQTLVIAPGTVKRHVHNILGKVRARNRAEVVTVMQDAPNPRTVMSLCG